MDAQSTIADALGIAALVRGLAYAFRVGRVPIELNLTEWIEHDNHYVASRYGREGDFIANKMGERRGCRKLIENSLGAVRQALLEAGEGDYFKMVEEWVTGESPAAEQCRIEEEYETTKALVEKLADRFEAELASGTSSHNHSHNSRVSSVSEFSHFSDFIPYQL